MDVTVFDGKKAVQKRVNLSDLRIKGQTSGEWISLGDFHLDAGKKGYAEISNSGANGTVVADAMLWKPE